MHGVVLPAYALAQHFFHAQNAFSLVTQHLAHRNTGPVRDDFGHHVRVNIYTHQWLVALGGLEGSRCGLDGLCQCAEFVWRCIILFCQLPCSPRRQQQVGSGLLSAPDAAQGLSLGGQRHQQAINRGKARGVHRLLVVLITLQATLFTLQRLPLALFVFQHIGLGALQNLDPGTGRVQQIHGLVGQLPARDVAAGQLGGSHDGIVAHDNVVDVLVFFFQSAQDQDSRREVRLVQLDQLKAPGERSVFFKVFFVFSPGGGGNGPQLTARQRRLEQIGRVRTAGLSASAYQRVRFVNEKNNGRGRRLDLVDHAFQAVFKFALDAGAGLQQAHVQPQNRHTLQGVGNVGIDDAQRQAFDHRGFSNARVAYADRVVLSAPGQDVHHLANFQVAAKHRIDFASPGFFREVFTKSLDGACFAATRPCAAFTGFGSPGRLFNGRRTSG